MKSCSLPCVYVCQDTKNSNFNYCSCAEEIRANWGHKTEQSSECYYEHEMFCLRKSADIFGEGQLGSTTAVSSSATSLTLVLALNKKSKFCTRHKLHNFSEL